MAGGTTLAIFDLLILLPCAAASSESISASAVSQPSGP
jgi:hypothetical protein